MIQHHRPVEQSSLSREFCQAQQVAHSGVVMSQRGNLHPSNQTKRDNIYSRNLLTLVAEGAAIITEIHRLVDLVPAPFKHLNDIPTGAQHYLDRERKITFDNIIFDFNYFKNAEALEKNIENDKILKNADENLCDNVIDILNRFYLTFESVHRYATDLNNFIADLEDEALLGHSLDTLIQDPESLQLLSEAYFLLGYMLLTIDNNFEGGLRERLIVSYYRYSSYRSSLTSNLDDTCNLMRSTGYRCASQKIYRTSTPVNFQRPDSYPENFFKRVKVNGIVVDLLIAKLQSVDLYNQTLYAFPHPSHKSAGLAQQGSILYVLLYFCPSILHTERSRMRGIIDKFFADSWVINVHLGDLANLFEVWSQYKAARESLSQLFDNESVKLIASEYRSKFERTSNQLREYLKEGWLNADSVLDQGEKILNSVRDANVVLRWMLLQSQNDSCWQSRISLTNHTIVNRCIVGREALYGFLQNLSELESRFAQLYRDLCLKKDQLVSINREKATETLQELIAIFDGSKPLRDVQPNSSSTLLAFLRDLSSKIESENSKDTIIGLIKKLQLAQESFTDGMSLQVLQIFSETRDSLMKMYRSLALNEDLQSALHSITDFNYAWKLMDSTFTILIQKVIKIDPVKVHGLKSIFVKLASASDIHLRRIQQAKAQDDLTSVSQYYTSKLVAYVREVLQIIPATILELLTSIISIQTENPVEDIPSRVALDKVRDYISTEKRQQMLELTYRISHYAESLLMMQNATIGLTKINSKQLLEDGIRRELVRRISDTIHEIIQFESPSNNSQPNNSTSSENLLHKLNKLDSIMNGYKKSFEYIQDYLFIYGLQMWQEELNRIVNFNVEQATEYLLNESERLTVKSRGPLSFDQISSIYQSSKAPIPIYSSDPLVSSFVSRILDEILAATDPRSTIYDEQLSTWFEQKGSKRRLVISRIFELIASSLGLAGLNGLDKVCCALAALELKKLDSSMVELSSGSNNSSQSLVTAIKVIEDYREQQYRGAIPFHPDKQITSVSTGNFRNASNSSRIFGAVSSKIAPHSDKLTNHLLRIGQIQIIRDNISCVLSTRSRHEAPNLFGCLEALNSSLMASIRNSSQQKSAISHNVCNNLQADDEASSLFEDELVACQSSSNDLLANQQLMFKLTNHLEWVGLSDPMSKIYTTDLQSSQSAHMFEFRRKQVAMSIMFALILDQCSKFHFSRSIKGFLPRQSKSFYETSYNVDGQPLFYGLMTLVNHYQPFLNVPSTSKNPIDNFNGATGTFRELVPDNYESHKFFMTGEDIICEPLERLLELMSLYVKTCFDHFAATTIGEERTGTSLQLRIENWPLELSNMILSIIELIRLSRFPSKKLLAKLYLPSFILDTFQFTYCHMSNSSSNSAN